MGKLFPSGFKKRRGKVRFAVPPPGYDMDSESDYKRSREKREIDEQIEEALEDHKPIIKPEKKEESDE